MHSEKCRRRIKLQIQDTVTVRLCLNVKQIIYVLLQTLTAIYTIVSLHFTYPHRSCIMFCFCGARFGGSLPLVSFVTRANTMSSSKPPLSRKHLRNPASNVLTHRDCCWALICNVEVKAKSEERKKSELQYKRHVRH